MTMQQLSCALQIDKQMKQREEQIQELVSHPDADWIQDDPALSIDKREVYSICLSWGGPADYIEVTLNDGQIERMVYRYSDWFDTATQEFYKNSPLWQYAEYQIQMMKG